MDANGGLIYPLHTLILIESQFLHQAHQSLILTFRLNHYIKGWGICRNMTQKIKRRLNLDSIRMATKVLLALRAGDMNFRYQRLIRWRIGLCER